MPKPATVIESKVEPNPALEKRTRRVFTADYKLSVLQQADACQQGELGDLLPSGVILREHDRQAAGDFLHRFILDFIGRSQAILQQAVMNSRCDGVWVSVCAATDLFQEKSPFNLYTQTTLWHVSDATEASKARLWRFAELAAGKLPQNN